MATLLLTTVGTALGGPIGGLLGAMAGQRIDQRLFGPKGRTGPRLAELAVQASTYGALVPALFGKTRVAGSVIWATDLVETRKKVSTGKGQPKATVYSYAANFAVLLSSRPVLSVGRIWADGKLLRGAAGDFKTETQFRLHTGSPDQPPDPFIAAAEGAGATPAYRGLAYAMFEGFALEAYGNRIPSLSFEVIADNGPVRLGQILPASLVADQTATTMDGFPSGGASFRAMLGSLNAVIPLRLIRGDTGLCLKEVGDLPMPVAARDMGAAAGERAGPRQAFDRATSPSAGTLIALRYYDAERDYQPGLQRAVRPGGQRVEDRIDLPATLSAQGARVLAERLASHRSSNSHSVRVTLPWRRLDIRAGQDVVLEGVSGRWHVCAIRLEKMALHLDLCGVPDSVLPRAASSGRPVSEGDLPHGPTLFELLDLPPMDENLAGGPLVAVAAAGASAGWRRAALLSSRDGGSSWEEAGSTAPPAILGTALTALGAGSPYVLDRRHVVDVALVGAHMMVSDADGLALLSGANAAMLGSELIQFGRAEQIAPGQYRLSELARGRRGTEWAISAHQAGEAFVLLDRDSLAFLDAPHHLGPLSVSAVGLDDAVPPVKSLPAIGAALQPLIPCHLRAQKMAGGDTIVTWVRRSRIGWAWADQVDAPLGEETEHYQVRVVPNVGVPRYEEALSPTWTYSAAARASDQLAGTTSITLEVRQRGISFLSRPAQLTIALV